MSQHIATDTTVITAASPTMSQHIATDTTVITSVSPTMSQRIADRYHSHYSNVTLDVSAHCRQIPQSLQQRHPQCLSTLPTDTTVITAASATMSQRIADRYHSHYNSVTHKVWAHRRQIPQSFQQHHPRCLSASLTNTKSLQQRSMLYSSIMSQHIADRY